MKTLPPSSGAIGALFLAIDLTGLIAAFNVLHRVNIGSWVGLASPLLFALVGIVLLSLYVLDVYRADDLSSKFNVPLRTAFGVVLAGIVVASLLYITETWESDTLLYRGVLPGAMVIFAVWATLWRFVITRWVWSAAQRTRWLVVGEGARLGQFWQDYSGFRSIGEFQVVTPGDRAGDAMGELAQAVVGTYEDIDALKDRDWTGVIIAAERGLPSDLVSKIMDLRLTGLRVYDLADFYERYLQKVPVMHLGDSWFALSHGFDLLHHNVELKIKRILDVALAAALLILTAPLMVVVAVAIALDRRQGNVGPVFYSQLRTGMNGREFRIHKFRTMIRDAETQGARWAEKDDPRVTRIGRVLRSTRIDELPQLWNVLKGEMSFIGPRPERPDFNRQLEEAIPYYDLRHLVKPGITGWAQVMYPYGSSIDDALQKLQYDIFYIKNYSLPLDVMIMLKTLRVVLGRRGR